MKPTTKPVKVKSTRPTCPEPARAQLVDLAAIETDPKNPREDFAEGDLAAFAASLTSRAGLLAPIHIRPNGAAGKFLLIAGERRYRAAKLAGWTAIPAFVRDVDQKGAAEIMVAENVHRKDLNPLERARALQLLIDTGATRQEAGATFGISADAVSNVLRLLKLPAEWQQRVAKGELMEAQARCLAPHAKRPDVLAAVAADMEANPSEWRTCADFERLVAVVAQHVDALATVPAAPADVFPRVVTGASQEAPPAAAGRRSAPVPHEAPEATLEDPLGVILALVPELPTVKALGQVRLALDARQQELTPPRKRRVK